MNTNIYNDYYKIKNNSLGTIIFETLFFISLILMVIGYLEVVIVPANQELLNEFTWYSKYLIAEEGTTNIYTSFYSYLIGYCCTATCFIFICFSFVFKYQTYKTIKQLIEHSNSDSLYKTIKMDKLAIYNFFIGIFIAPIILSTIKELIVSFEAKNDLKMYQITN